MIGKTISHYKILEKLGEGGMGVVYKAEDTKLKRTVALKFLSPQAVGTAEEKTRFVHEAQAAASLNHPNICTIYEIDQIEEQSFIAMEHIDGQSLKAKIEVRPLEIDAVIDIALQVAAGLREAHEKGIIHRDIKSANVMVTQTGQAKIMDFGLAKSPGKTQLTKDGTTVGTVAYMSPEQGRGDAVDHKSDIWSLGVVLYEMIAGSLPFKGDHEQAVMYSILNENPVPLTGVRSGVPMDLEKIVGKCLEKDPQGRYQHVDDLMVDLKQMAASMTGPSKVGRVGTVKSTTIKSVIGRGLGVVVIAVVIALGFVAIYPRFFAPAERESISDIKKVAVLVFENLGPPQDEYFANGITDAITARLAGIRGLGVISRQSAMQYKGSDRSIQKIGNELGVDYILEGTVQRERPQDPESRVRVIPQLIRVSDDLHVWAATYDENMTGVFRVQSEIAERVARELDVKLLDPERTRLDANPTENIEAYEYYMRGLDYFDRAEVEQNARAALRMYERAVELDPDFALAWAALSRAQVWIYWAFDKMGELSMAEAASDRALQLAPDLPEAHVARGYIYYYGRRDYEKALEHFNTARQLRPSDAEATGAAGFILRRQGKWEDAIARMKNALEMDPRSFVLVEDVLGWTYCRLRRYPEADRHLSRMITLAPDAGLAYVFKSHLHLIWDGDVEKARRVLRDGAHNVAAAELAQALTDILNPVLRILSDECGEILDALTPQSAGMTSTYDIGVFYLSKAETNKHRNQMALAAAYYDSARVSLESAIREMPTSPHLPYLHCDLGQAYAGLGFKERGVEECKKGTDLLPISKDAADGADLLEVLARVYSQVGEYELAIDQLEILLAVPSQISVPLLRIDPVWDPLRDHPHFQGLLKKYSGADL
ncbi:MAG: protein kinase [Candidatus Latescibacterota bacterium]|nr:MAG: protein kinase [Candidatus Latescibacterota bacterium]